MKNLIALPLVVCLFYASCIHTAKTVAEEGIPEIEIISNLSKPQKGLLSEVASNIEYIALETDRKCLVSGRRAYGSKEYIVTIGSLAPNHPVCYVFERGTGKFVRQISSYGRGPGEYTEIIGFLEGEKEQVVMWGNNQRLFYNLDGTLSHQTGRFVPFARYFVAYGDFYAGYVSNIFGNATTRIAFYDKTGVLVDSIPEYRSWERTMSSWGESSDSWLYVFDDNLYYKDVFCDTLYYIKDFELHPRYIFNTGGRAVPYEIQEGGRYRLETTLGGFEIIDRYERYINIIEIVESHRHLYFTVDYRQQLYPAVYDKTGNMIQILSPVSIPPPRSDWKISFYGFENDLDGGLPFWPQQMISDREMMCVYSAEELLELDISKITDPKLKEVLNSIDEFSNPVVAIVTLKD